MSDYLITQLRATPNVEVRLGARVADAHGDPPGGPHLEDRTGQRDEGAAAAVFIMIGAEPHTDGSATASSSDDRGFILTDRDCPGAWPLQRAPLPFETSLPGVFAVGDVRHGSVKRVAGAVGEGSVAVGSVHEYLAARESRQRRPSASDPMRRRLMLTAAGSIGHRDAPSSGRLGHGCIEPPWSLGQWLVVPDR